MDRRVVDQEEALRRGQFDLNVARQHQARLRETLQKREEECKTLEGKLRDVSDKSRRERWVLSSHLHLAQAGFLLKLKLLVCRPGCCQPGRYTSSFSFQRGCTQCSECSQPVSWRAGSASWASGTKPRQSVLRCDTETHSESMLCVSLKCRRTNCRCVCVCQLVRVYEVCVNACVCMMRSIAATHCGRESSKWTTCRTYVWVCVCVRV